MSLGEDITIDFKAEYSLMNLLGVVFQLKQRVNGELTCKCLCHQRTRTGGSREHSRNNRIRFPSHPNLGFPHSDQWLRVGPAEGNEIEGLSQQTLVGIRGETRHGSQFSQLVYESCHHMS